MESITCAKRLLRGARLRLPVVGDFRSLDRARGASARVAGIGSVAVAQTVRLRYLEQRHATMFSEFGKARMDMQVRIDELAREAARCHAPQG